MAELKNETLRITITEAALQKLGQQSEAFHQPGSDQLRPEYLAQCDKCLTFCAREEVGYRDESRTECRDCHEHDWRCEEDFGEDNPPEEATPVGDCPKCGRVMAIPVGGGFECRYHDCKRSS